MTGTRRIALLTDFGTRDPYVAAMKGVIVSRTDAPIFDLTHDIAPFDVLEAAWFLRCVVREWPEETIFVCVVDPGVGTKRNIIALQSEGKLFLAPDNGLLTFVSAISPLPAAASSRWGEGQGEGRSRESHGPSPRGKAGQPRIDTRFVTNETLFLPNGSTTFHGRDRFAPLAAALANGTPLETLGPPVESILTLPYKPPAYGEVVRGSIVAIDRFGNAITDIEVEHVSFAPFVLRIRDLTIERVETNYADAAPGPFLIAGSMGTLEISVAGASAAERLHLRRLDRVELRPQNV